MGQIKDSQTTITDMKTVVDHQTVKNQGYVKLNGAIFSCGVYVNMWYVKYLIKDINKNNMPFFYA